MGKVATSVFSLLLLGQSLTPGNTLRIQGRGFSFSIQEPSGWSIEFGSAPQIANFVAHPEGTDWREAEVVVFGRFTRNREARQTLSQFLADDLEGFKQRCPFYEIQEPKLELRGPHEFLVKELVCPGFRNEIVAVTETPGFLVSFILSSSQRDKLGEALPPFEILLSSFQWTQSKASTGPARPQPER